MIEVKQVVTVSSFHYLVLSDSVKSGHFLENLRHGFIYSFPFRLIISPYVGELLTTFKGIIHKGRSHKEEGVCQKRTGRRGGKGKCRHPHNFFKLPNWKKCLIVDDNLQITE